MKAVVIIEVVVGGLGSDCHGNSGTQQQQQQQYGRTSVLLGDSPEEPPVSIDHHHLVLAVYLKRRLVWDGGRAVVDRECGVGVGWRWWNVVDVVPQLSDCSGMNGVRVRVGFSPWPTVAERRQE